MKKYLGIIIRESLKNTEYISELPVVSKKDVGEWQLILVSIAVDDLEEHIKSLQNQMIHIADDCWYAHYFHDQELIVVYQDKVIKVGTDPTSWGEAIDYGLLHGIPLEQLDFKPYIQEEAMAMFS